MRRDELEENKMNELKKDLKKAEKEIEKIMLEIRKKYKDYDIGMWESFDDKPKVLISATMNGQHYMSRRRRRVRK